MRKVLNAKFCIIFVELIIVCFIFFTKFQNIAASNTSGTSFKSMVNYINAFVGLTVAMISLQLISSLLGLPFNKTFVPVQLTMQVVGLFLYSCYILMKMEYVTISYIWGVFCLIPFLIDVGSLVSQLIANRKYSLLDSK